MPRRGRNCKLQTREVQVVLSWLGAVLGAGCVLCLALSFGYSPEAIAAGDHLAAIGLTVRQCSGCAFCGLSRGFALFSAGRFAEGLALHPGIVVVYPFSWLLAVGGPAYALVHVTRKFR